MLKLLVKYFYQPSLIQKEEDWLGPYDLILFFHAPASKGFAFWMLMALDLYVNEGEIWS